MGKKQSTSNQKQASKSKKSSNKEPLKQKSQRSWLGIFGTMLMLLAIVGGFFSEFFAFWKYESTVPSMLEGNVFILPFSNISTIEAGSQPIIISETLILVIYALFLAASVLGFIGSLLYNRKIAMLGSNLGMIAVPLSIYLVTTVITKYNLVFQGTAFSGLFSYNQVLNSGTYTIGLWIGFFLCAAGTYILALGIPKTERRRK